MHMSISPPSGVRGLERLTCLKYYIVLKQQSTFNLELNVAENTDNLKKIQKKLLRIQFPAKN